MRIKNLRNLNDNSCNIILEARKKCHEIMTKALYEYYGYDLLKDIVNGEFFKESLNIKADIFTDYVLQLNHVIINDEFEYPHITKNEINLNHLKNETKTN
jgi:hypothetical protein